MLSRIENGLIFQPSRYPAGDWNPISLHHENIFLQTKDGVQLHAWYCRCPDHLPNLIRQSTNEQNRLVVVYFHGNAGNLSDRAGNIRDWQRALGIDFFIIDYRGYGRSSGQPSEAGVYLDSRAAYQWLTRERGIDPSRIVLLGRSLGGAVALELGLEVPHCCLLLEATFTSLPDVAKRLYPWLPIRQLMRSRFPSIERIGRYRRPVLITHGTNDGLVPVWQARELYAKANEPKKIYEVMGADHNDCTQVGGHAYFRVIENFLRDSYQHQAAKRPTA